jgi:hypothetical protein
LKFSHLPFVFRSGKWGSNDLAHFSIDQLALTPSRFEFRLKLLSHHAPTSTVKSSGDTIPVFAESGSMVDM